MKNARLSRSRAGEQQAPAGTRWIRGRAYWRLPSSSSCHGTSKVKAPRQSEHTRANEGATPARRAASLRSLGDRGTEHPRKGMQRRSLTNACPPERRCDSDRSLPGDNGVAHAGDREHGDHDPERIDETRSDKTGTPITRPKSATHGRPDDPPEYPAGVGSTAVTMLNAAKLVRFPCE